MTNESKTSKILNIFLWVAQVILAITFIWAGAMKLINPNELPFPWVKENESLVKLTGILDLLAGFGLIIPSLLQFHPRWTVFVAGGTILLMTAACIFHISRGEASQIGFNVFVALTAAFIAWGRHKKHQSYQN